MRRALYDPYRTHATGRDKTLCEDFRLSSLCHAVQMICVVHSATEARECGFSHNTARAGGWVGIPLLLFQAVYVSDEIGRQNTY